MIEVRDVGKSFPLEGKEVKVLSGIDLDVTAGEFVALIGPSGCGKTTLLNLVAGLVQPTTGQIRYEGHEVRGINTHVGYVTQKDTLLPWRTVEGNIAVALDVQRVPAAEKRQRVQAFVKKVGLSGFERHLPHQISGGMRSRVAIARTLIYNPTTIIMDEPFAALDALLRLRLQTELLDIWSEFKTTILYVTHDLSEAIALADRVLVFTQRPARIKLDQRVELPRPRDISKVHTTHEFGELYDLLWRALREEVWIEG
ncbi:MAG: ABC transporter ATP-binding protein [Chloroflexota bacterium]|nr:MAG: ABC transporter ATP-binding protein [Chloroflexota bacterium]